MLSIASISSGSSEYYISMSAERYYDEGVIESSSWIGTGSGLLGLAGRVEPPEFQALMKGETIEGERLVQSSGRRQPGWDLTFSVPKSVSVTWALGDEPTRKVVSESHRLAVTRAIEYVEESVIVTRRGKGGSVKEPCRLVGTLFHHGTSRNNDPQIHTHVLIHNVCVRLDGTTGTVMSKPLYEAKMEIGNVYRRELRARLEAQGIRTYDTPVAFEIEGVDRRLLREFSSRRKEIEEVLGSSERGAKASERAALVTRSRKTHPDLDSLRESWKGRAEGWEPKSVPYQPKENPMPLSPDIGQAFRTFSKQFGPDILDPLRKLTAKHGPDILEPLKMELARFGPDLGEPLRGNGPDIGQIWETASQCAVVRLEQVRTRLLRTPRAEQGNDVNSEKQVELPPRQEPRQDLKPSN